ncbi:hypothetical protein [Streptomyces scabiei]|uniref:hypothetical protein n=1 Tax=Streptomyces scabiei TaxID=1930 RepID=UPI0029AA9843|nr:hypothetical protein [Streptomyces scabiei]MDX3026736.1 hypothetical protein [Streptomyces scabiei]MDX3208080.1 hypothetical protein [Streptomyces scabiei]
MSNEVLVGVIGLSGAIVGAAAAFAGVVYQQRNQARLARIERSDALAQAAVDTLTSEIQELRRLVWSLSSDAEEPPEFREAFSRHVDVIELAALRLPDKELREAIQAACYVGFGSVDQFQAHVGLPVRKAVTSAMCWDVQKCLGAFLRHESRPDTTFLFKARDYYHAAITNRTPT